MAPLLHPERLRCRPRSGMLARRRTHFRAAVSARFHLEAVVGREAGSRAVACVGLLNADVVEQRHVLVRVRRVERSKWRVQGGAGDVDGDCWDASMIASEGGKGATQPSG